MSSKNIQQYSALSFCKVRYKSKRPFEEDWVNKPYSWEQIQEHRQVETNFGVLCGYNGLIVVDCDEQELIEAVHAGLPETFEVQTGSGGTHCYYFCPEVTKKIVLQNEVKHYGEVQAKGAQVVAATSIHPNGNEYKIFKDVPIQTITLMQLMDCVGLFVKRRGEERAVVENSKFFGDDDIKAISITSVVDTLGLKRHKNGELYGSNPWHGSSTGQNFWVNTSKNVAHCFRCDTGLGIAQCIALNEGIIKNCSDDMGPDGFRKVIDIAVEKYGLKRRKVDVEKIYDFIKGVVEANKAKGEEYPGGKDDLSISHKLMLFVERYHKKRPFYYDDAGMWWIWCSKNKMWTITDDIALLLDIHKSEAYDVIESKSKNEVITAMKLIGRMNKPIDIPLSWVQFKNGIIDIDNGDKIIQPSNRYFTLNAIPWNIGQIEDTPTLDKLFEEWVGKDYVRLLYEMITYSILPQYPLSRIFCLFGAGSNGKSTYLEILSKFLGGHNITSTELDLLTTNRFEVTKMHKKLACIMGETNLSELGNSAIIKKLTGRDPISFEYKYAKRQIDERNYAKLFVATNNLPPTLDKTVGFYRRWIVIDFPKQFADKRDIIKEIPDSEFEALAKKSIRILKELLANREFTNEGTIEQKIQRYEDRSDPLEKFIKEFCDLDDPNGIIFKFEFEKRLNQWCEQNRFRHMSEITILKKMKDKGVVQEKKPMEWSGLKQDSPEKRYIRAWCGIKWKTN